MVVLDVRTAHVFSDLFHAAFGHEKQADRPHPCFQVITCIKCCKENVFKRLHSRSAAKKMFSSDYIREVLQRKCFQLCN